MLFEKSLILLPLAVKELSSLRYVMQQFSIVAKFGMVSNQKVQMNILKYNNIKFIEDHHRNITAKFGLDP